MWLGPVFHAELVTLARQRRFYFGRALYGLLVLVIVTTTYHSMISSYATGEEVPIAMSARFGQAIFGSFATLQGIIVLAMTPSLVAGAIADERQRKTLHYLMASQLTATEIVLGKVAARLLRVAILGAIGLPVLNIIALFGGVDFAAVLLVYAATAATTFFLAAVSILCSVLAPKPRDAIMQAYFYEILWLAFAPICLASMRFWSPFWLPIGEFCRPALAWIAASAPSNLLSKSALMGSFNQLIEDSFWMIGLQVAYGTGLLIIATWRLRPAFRGADGPTFWARVSRRRAVPRGRIRLWARPAVADDAMLWKEMHLHRISDFRIVAMIVVAMVIVGAAVYSSWDIGQGAVNEIRTNGFWSYGSNQETIHDILAASNAVTIVVLLIGLGSVAASSISSEREGDTWTNLTAAPLSGLEVIRAKIVGTLWLFRPLAVYLLGCWTFGLLIGALHPVGVLISLVELIVFAWFAVSLGVACSLRLKNTIQAMTVTIGLLLFLNAGYLFFFPFPFLEEKSRVLLFGCMPYLFTVGLLGVDEYRQHLSGPAWETLTASVAGTLAYACGAIYSTTSAILRYDRIVDRPERTRNDPTLANFPKSPQVATAEL